MRIVAKDVTGQVYSTYEIDIEGMRQELRDAYGVIDEEECAALYRKIMNTIKSYKSLDTINLNTGSPDYPNVVTLNTAHVVCVSIENPITEWEDTDDTSTWKDDPRLWR